MQQNQYSRTNSTISVRIAALIISYWNFRSGDKKQSILLNNLSSLLLQFPVRHHFTLYERQPPVIPHRAESVEYWFSQWQCRYSNGYWKYFGNIKFIARFRRWPRAQTLINATRKTSLFLCTFFIQEDGEYIFQTGHTYFTQTVLHVHIKQIIYSLNMCTYFPSSSLKS